MNEMIECAYNWIKVRILRRGEPTVAIFEPGWDFYTDMRLQEVDTGESVEVLTLPYWLINADEQLKAGRRMAATLGYRIVRAEFRE